ncbi:MAG TPA: CsbD family protein [Solirubrobacterales bacterium]|nr:CsbD family protein [Solirubrobacterales bacterium]
MTEKFDEAKGRTKEAVGDLTDDEGMKREGQIDRATSTAKEKIGEAADKVKHAVGRDRDDS